MKAALRAPSRMWTFRLALLDYGFNFLRYLDGDNGALVSMKYEMDCDRAPVQAILSVTLDPRRAGPLDLFNQYFKPYALLRMPRAGTDGTPYVGWSQGVFRVGAAPKTIDAGDKRELQIQAYDLAVMYDWPQIEQSFTAQPGDLVTAKIAAAFALGPLTATNIAASTVTLAEAKRWEPGTSLLKVIDDLCAAGHLQRFWDADGVFNVRPYVDPAIRAIEDTLDENDNVLLVQAKESQDVFGRANKVIGVSAATSGEGNALIGSESITAIAVPHSSANLKKPDGSPWVIPKVFTNLDAGDLATIQSRVQELANDEARAPFIVEGGCKLQPAWGYRPIIAVTRGDLGYAEDKFEVTKYSYDYSAAAKMSFTATKAVSRQ